jgi:hypothetical protein
MSKQNKANKSNYIQAGRLTPDDMARERTKMRTVRGATAESGTEGPGRRKGGNTARPQGVSGGESARRSRRSGSEE